MRVKSVGLEISPEALTNLPRLSGFMVSLAVTALSLGLKVVPVEDQETTFYRRCVTELFRYFNEESRFDLTPLNAELNYLRAQDLNITAWTAPEMISHIRAASRRIRELQTVQKIAEEVDNDLDQYLEVWLLWNYTKTNQAMRRMVEEKKPHIVIVGYEHLKAFQGLQGYILADARNIQHEEESQYNDNCDFPNVRSALRKITLMSSIGRAEVVRKGIMQLVAEEAGLSRFDPSILPTLELAYQREPNLDRLAFRVLLDRDSEYAWDFTPQESIVFLKLTVEEARRRFRAALGMT
ncbi:MAG: hypothetical protein HY073_02555 [Deltaproteobacteria bacterium]|nr:hypothetical protein [Deltaproteobacteria bacterium]